MTGSGRAGCLLIGLFEGALDTGFHADEEAAIVFEFVLSTEDLGLGRVDLLDVGVEAFEEFTADLALLGAGGDEVDEVVKLRL